MTSARVWKRAAPRSNFAGLRLHIEYVATERVLVARRAVRKHPQAQLRRLADSISRAGFNVPLIVDARLNLVCGFGRLEAAKLARLATVPVIALEHLTEEQLRLFSIWDNRIAEESEWDEQALNLEFGELRLEDPTLDLTDSGFAIAEIDAMAGRARTAELNDLDEVPDEPAVEPVSRLGDLWLCGRHRLICGDATDPAVISHLVDGREVRQLVTDPPYNLPTRAFSSSQHGNFAMGAGEMSAAEFTAFLASFLDAAKPSLVPGALVYAFMDWKHIAELLAAGATTGLGYKQLLVWTKAAPGMGSFYRSGHELVAVFQHGDGKATNNIMLGKHGRNRSNVLAYPGITTMGGRKQALKLHPTVKNVALIADLMLDASAPGELILDCFGGSGTTLIAAEKVERDACLCELSPGFVDVIVERFNRLGGEPARLAVSGQTFDELRGERHAPPSAGEESSNG